MTDWGKAPADPSLEWEFISKQAVATNVAQVTFSGFSTLFRRFALDFYIVSQQAVRATVVVTLNNDGAPNNDHYQSTLAQLEFNVLASDFAVITGDNFRIGQVAAGGLCGGGWSMILKPSATMNARYFARHVSEQALNSSFQVEQFDGEWLNTTDLISRIDFVGQVASGTRFVLSGARESLS